MRKVIVDDEEALRLLRAYRKYLGEQDGYEPKMAPTYKELVRALGLKSTSTLHSRWNKLREMGLVVCVKRGNYCHWRLTQAGVNYQFEETQ